MKTKVITFFFLILPFTIFGVTQKKNSKAINNAETAFELANQSYFDYDFESASDYFNQYKKLQEKKKKPVDESLEVLEYQLQNAETAFERIEKIIVIDSISLPKDTFFENYRLSSSAGRIKKSGRQNDNSALPEGMTVFENESGDYMLWTAQDENGRNKFYESNRLLNGKWENSMLDLVNDDEDADILFPFMSGDGQTLYFTMSGKESMGGYDIFMVQRDAITGEFRQPLNIGMPYNSPYDDMMMAIDEEKGVGWWATDRHNDDETVTVYVYLLNDMRQNYPSDYENLVEYARIDNYKLTQPENKDSEIKEVLASLPDEKVKVKKTKNKDFELNMGKGKIYTSFSDFKNNKASQEMNLYLKKDKELKTAEIQLSEMRKRYSAKEKNLATKIEELEKRVETLREETAKALSMVYRLEKSTR